MNKKVLVELTTKWDRKCAYVLVCNKNTKENLNKLLLPYLFYNNN